MESNPIEGITRYKTIVADPPWRYSGSGPASSKQHRPNSYGASPSSHERYGSMSIKELSDMPIRRMSEDKAHLYLWVTNAFIERGWQLCKDWGFDPKTVVTWGKVKSNGTPSMKTGYYFRGATEHFIFATKGNLRLKTKEAFPTLFLSERLPHSVKPEWFYELVEHVSYDRRLELFARNNRDGWDAFGNQVANSININDIQK
jgi:N6-adenosine-specific RNA methylase IME4